MTIIFKKYIFSKLFDIFRQGRKKKDVQINELYESYAMGRISEHRFDTLCAEYEREQADLEAMIAAEQSAQEAFHNDTGRADHSRNF